MNIGIVVPKSSKSKAYKRVYEELSNLGCRPLSLPVNESVVEILEDEIYIKRRVGEQLGRIVIDGALLRLGSASSKSFALVQALETKKIPVTSRAMAIKFAGDKLLSGIILAENKIPTPHTIAAISATNRKIIPPIVDKVQENSKSPLIVKTRSGSSGNGVTLVESRRGAISHLEALGRPSIVQKMISPSHVDTRVIVIDNQIVASMQRVGDDRDFRANLGKKGTGFKYNLTDNQAELALKTAEVSGLGIVGVDIMTDSNLEKDYVIEYNSNPGLEIENVTGINIAKYMARFALKLAIEGYGKF